MFPLHILDKTYVKISTRVISVQYKPVNPYFQPQNRICYFLFRHINVWILDVSLSHIDSFQLYVIFVFHVNPFVSQNLSNRFTSKPAKGPGFRRLVHTCSDSWNCQKHWLLTTSRVNSGIYCSKTFNVEHAIPALSWSVWILSETWIYFVINV